MEHPPFPLGKEKYFAFGVRPKEHFNSEGIWVSVAQRNLRVRWGAKDVQSTGRFDAATSAAVCRVQMAIGHWPNGELDEETWNAIFTRSKMDHL